MTTSFFYWIGGKFYLDWILPTNPISKNPIFRILWGWTKKFYTAYDYKGRFFMAWVFGLIHLQGFLSPANWLDLWACTINILVNLYPIFCQIHLGGRCWKIIKRKKTRKKLM